MSHGVAVSTEVVQISLQRHRRPTERRWPAKTWLLPGFSWGPPWQWQPKIWQPQARRPTSSLRRVHLQDLGDLQYIAEVSIGSSSSTFRLILDTGSSDLWVSGEQFIPSLSDTWTPLPQAGLVKLDYGQGEVEGIVGVDKACLLAKPVPLCVEQEFLVAKQVSDLSLNTFDGILGLGLPGLSHANQDFVQSLARSYREVQCFSFSLNREDSKSFALFGPCAKLLRKAAKETHLPEEQAALLSVQRLFGFARGWWLVSLAISCDGTRIWQGPDMYSICGLEVAALLLLSLYPGRRSSRGQSSDCRKRVCNACFALCSFFQALVLMLLLIALLVLLAPMVVNAFQSKVLVALDTGTSLIVIPTENFQQVADAMFGLRLRDSCVLSNSELLCACEVAAEAKALDFHLGDVRLSLHPLQMFANVNAEILGDQPACRSGLATQDLRFWILGDVFLSRSAPRGVRSMRVLRSEPKEKRCAVRRWPSATGRGLRILIYGDSLTAGAPSMVPFAQELHRALEGGAGAESCEVETTACGLCASTALQMLAVLEEPYVVDALGGSWGSGLVHLAKEASLAIIMAGTNDLASPAPAGDVSKAIQGMHVACHRVGVPTVALGVPDAGGRFIRRLGQALPTKRRAVNAALAVWAREGFEDGTRPELFINTSALLPHGPRSRRAGHWERDGVHFTAQGAEALGARLARILRPLVQRRDAEALGRFQGTRG
ncbi:unnamed protein product [Effrenium voratum]|uniref:Peptidase A1 domain-containing protein n=1 Tax=Effrenium voratum TaxID=2562239 RepID=A0AA36NIM3_9DINO|nr:unnamed protein product [Effrenium voratum]